MLRFSRILVSLTLAFAMFGCAGLQPDYETPTVGVSSFRVLPSEGAVPRFEIGLHIVNPNRSALKLEGIVYSVILEGHKVLTGVSNELPMIEAYGEEDVVLIATADLLNSIGLFATLLQSQREKFDYELEVKLDIGSFRPRIHVSKKGEVSLRGAAAK